jgi:hypothetical protein
MLRAGSMLVLSVFAGLGVATAAEQPISASRLMLRRSSSGKEKLTFVSKDSAFLFPAIGGPDDPTPAGSGGLVVELFSATTPAGVALAAPGGVGNPGWSVRTSVPPRLQFKNSAAPGALSTFRSITLGQAKQIKLNGKETGLDVSAPLGAVGIRITTGSLVNCARFGPGTVTRDANGTFIARDALASALADCSDGSLAGTPPTTTTLAGTCGDGVVNQPSEQCDGADSAACAGVLACGQPGYTACRCCANPSAPTFPSDVYPCCDPTATPVYSPSFKTCVTTTCDGPFPCTLGECHDGACCAAVGAVCGILGGGSGAGVPCCDPAAVCAPSETPITGICCLPPGTTCSGDAECCTGTCSGTCAP